MQLCFRWAARETNTLHRSAPTIIPDLELDSQIASHGPELARGMAGKGSGSGQEGFESLLVNDGDIQLAGLLEFRAGVGAGDHIVSVLAH